MFSHLRWRLTLLYASATLLFIALLSIGSYALLTRYFQSTTDLALQHKMAHEFIRRHATLPPELAAADETWVSRREPAETPTLAGAPHTGSDEQVRESITDEESFSGELAAIFVVPLDERGQRSAAADTFPLPIAPDRAAAQNATRQGYDWRTVAAASGTRVRLLTYRLRNGSEPGLIQAGRTLGDQDRVLQQLLEGLAALGSGGTVLIGVGSWWLAGRSLRPAQQAWTHQQTFVANASHELRTPLTLLQASADVARRTLPADAAESHALLDDVLSECLYMSSLLDDLLLLSRLDARRLPLELQVLSLGGVWTDVQRQVGRLAAARSISLSVEPTSAMVMADATRLRQVLLIVIDNALRYTPPGGSIQLTVASQPQQAIICIADTGCGIAPEHMPHLFERFYQADTAHSGTRSGSGLGLALAKALMEAQHGWIKLASRPGAGTQVWIAVPSAG